MIIRKVTSTLLSLTIGGLIGGQVQKRWNSGDWITSVKAAQPLVSSRPSEIMKYGFPTNNNIKMRENYVLSYDRRNRSANWVFEHLTKELIQKTKNSEDRNTMGFVEDPTIPRIFRSSNHDYYKSGFDRGHLAAAANHRADSKWMKESFYLSNIIPQDPNMNQHAWNNLERYVRSLAYHYENVYVCTGPLYLPKRMGDGKLYVNYQVLEPNHVAVPTHLFKVVLCQKKGKFELKSYLMANEPIDPTIPLSKFLVPIETIERASGLLMFSGIPENMVKRKKYDL